MIERYDCNDDDRLRLPMVKIPTQVKFEFVTVEMVGEAFEQVVRDQK